ncbi:MAG: hypothetical protein DIU78_009425 [Pseudomonadota bacterium]|nr:MAG: hypothetical protein DIU78_00620 [Pseudomonadota bacterium]
MQSGLKYGSLAALSFLASTITTPAAAKSGTHPVVVSTWDTRASSVQLQYRHGFMDGGGFNLVGYNANFSATSGKLSAQFGIHYLSHDEGEDTPLQHGLSATATAVFAFPLAPRFENGLPRAALGFYVGSAPTALVSGERNYLSVPLVFGLGVPLSPAKAITITPWGELSPAVNLDTTIRPFRFEDQDPTQFIDPTTGDLTLDVSDIESVLAESVELETSMGVGARAGVDFALHLSDAVDIGLNATLSSVGTAFSGARVIYVGGGLVFRWDDIVPAVLPAERRLEVESCDAIEQRFRQCPNRRLWKSPEELSAEQPVSSNPPPAPLDPPTHAPFGTSESTPVQHAAPEAPAPNDAGPPPAASDPAASDGAPAPVAPEPEPGSPVPGAAFPPTP